MRGLATFIAIALLPIGLASCFPGAASFGSGGGICKTEDPEGVNTYKPSGQWKRLTYTPARSSSELEVNFDILVVEPGNQVCMTEILNGVQAGAIFRGSYTHDVGAKSMLFTYEVGLSGQENLQYSFSGSCDDTRMSLRSNDGSVVSYELFNVEANVGDCHPQ